MMLQNWYRQRNIV